MPTVFRTNVDGSSILSTDYSIERSSPLDFALDNLVAARVPIEKSPSVENLSLDGMDKVEKASIAILQRNNFIDKTKDNN